MIRAYHDPALRHPVSKDGTWRMALEFIAVKNQSRRRSMYVHNGYPTGIPLRFSADVQGFALQAPPGITLMPGVTKVDVTIEAGDLPSPLAVDFLITGATTTEYGRSGYSGQGFTGLDYTSEPGIAEGTLFKAEASAFVLPAGDERFGEFGRSPLRNAATLTDYVASGMGFASDNYRDTVVNFVTSQLYDSALWALNKHYMFDPRFSSMSKVDVRARSIGYDPPGVPGLHPYLRRRVYAYAFHITRRIGSADGIRMVYGAMGIPLRELRVWREDFTWHVRIPQWVAALYSMDFLGNLALYHVDPYMNVDVRVNEGTLAGQYYQVDYTVEPGPSVAPPIEPPEEEFGFLLTEEGAFLVTEDDRRVAIEEPFWWPEEE